MANCRLHCGGCVGEALSVSGDAHLAAAGCTFDTGEGEGEACDGTVGMGILSQHAPVLAERCTFMSTASGKGCALEGVRLQGSSHVFTSCDWHRCLTGICLTDDAAARLLGCSWTLCAAGLHAVSKSQADADNCVLLRNDSAIVLEEGAHARCSCSHFVLNGVAAAARSATLQLRSSCCIFDAAALLLDRRAAAALDDSAFIGASRSAVADDEDTAWLRGDTVHLSAGAVATAVQCIARARQALERDHDTRRGASSPPLHIACLIKSVSCATW